MILSLPTIQTLEEVISCLADNIPIETRGVCDPQMLFEILIRASSTGDSIENTCRIPENVPGGNDIRYHPEKFDDMASLEEQICGKARE